MREKTSRLVLGLAILIIMLHTDRRNTAHKEKKEQKRRGEEEKRRREGGEQQQKVFLSPGMGRFSQRKRELDFHSLFLSGSVRAVVRVVSCGPVRCLAAVPHPG